MYTTQQKIKKIEKSIEDDQQKTKNIKDFNGKVAFLVLKEEIKEQVKTPIFLLNEDSLALMPDNS